MMSPQQHIFLLLLTYLLVENSEKKSVHHENIPYNFDALKLHFI